MHAGIKDNKKLAIATIEHVVVMCVGQTLPKGHPLSTDHANDGIVSHPHRSSWLENLLNTGGNMTSVMDVYSDDGENSSDHIAIAVS